MSSADVVVGLYRMAMYVLYGGKYHRRFTNIVDSMGRWVSSVCDLCFGDIVIAEWCCFHSIRWVGVDLNHHFCERARKRGFDVLEGDIFSLQLPDADVFVMTGSLYHFHARLGDFFDLVLSHTGRPLLLEPVKNLSSGQDLIGRWAQRSADPRDGDTTFRYNEQSLYEALSKQQRRICLKYRVLSVDRDALIEVTR
jgi:hypothetical protein